MANETTPTPQQPDSAPPGWYPDPYRSGDLSTEWYWNGKTWSGRTRIVPGRPDLRPQPSTAWAVLICVALALAVAAWVALIVAMNASSGYWCAEMYAGIPNPGDPALGVSALFGVPSFALSVICLAKVRHGNGRFVAFAFVALAVSALGYLMAAAQALSLTGC